MPWARAIGKFLPFRNSQEPPQHPSLMKGLHVFEHHADTVGIRVLWQFRHVAGEPSVQLFEVKGGTELRGRQFTRYVIRSREYMRCRRPLELS